MSVISGKPLVMSGFGKDVRADLEALFASAGAIVTHSVSGKTQILVTGPKPGPDKVAKAQSAGAEIWDEATARAALK